MTIGEALIEFIRTHYVIEFWMDFPFGINAAGEFRPNLSSARRIIIKDVHDSRLTNDIRQIDICKIANVDVIFLWSKIQEIAGFDIYHKDINNLPSLIMKIFREQQSKDFYHFLIEQDMKVIIPLKMVKEEFPSLYGGLPEDFKFSNT